MTIDSIAQPDPFKFSHGRNEVFDVLPKDTDEVIMLGNSLTQTFEWHEIFKNVNMKNRGINGDQTKDILQRINEIVESKPNKIFIEIGINDLLGGNPIDSVLNNINQTVQIIKLKSPKTRIYIQNILPLNPDICYTPRTPNFFYTDIPVIEAVKAFNKKLKRYCVKNNLIYIDLFSIFVSKQGLNLLYDCGDKLHLNGHGYLIWCNSIRDYVYE